MSTLVLNVNIEQEQILEGLLRYMNISFQKVSSSDDFWDSLSEKTKDRIEQGRLDANEGRFAPAKSVIEQILAKRRKYLLLTQPKMILNLLHLFLKKNTRTKQK